MQVRNELSTGESVAPKAALLIHRSESRHGSYRGHGNNGFATLHAVLQGKGGKSSLGAGRLLAASEIERVLCGLNPSRGLRLLPATLLARSEASVVWWMPAQSRRVWFASRDSIGEQSAVVPLPPCVFALGDGELRVFALGSPERPEANTRLFQAPFYNVWAGGKVCTGQMVLPSVSDDAVSEKTEASFFESRFTHPNIHEAKKLTLWRGGGVALWKSLLAGRHKAFPTRALVPLSDTLGSWVEKFGGDK